MLEVMINRALALRVMYAALAATALLGVTAVLVQDEETLWQLTGTSLAVAVASGLTCCWTLLGISRIFRRAASLLCIATGVELLLIILLIWSDPLGIREELNLLLCAWAIMVLLPLGVIAMVLTEHDSVRRAGWIGFIATQAATACFCIASWINDPANVFIGEVGAVAVLCGWLFALLVLPRHDRPDRLFNWIRIVGLCATAIFGITWITVGMQRMLGTAAKPDTVLLDIITTSGCLAAGIALCSLLNALRLPSGCSWLRHSTIACTWCTVMATAYIILRENHGHYLQDVDFMSRLAIALGIVSACGLAASGSLAAIQSAVQRMRSNTDRVQLHCPVCSMKQTITQGEQTCSRCLTIIRFDFELTRCQQCHYQRTGWSSETCPECGWIIGTVPTAPA